MNLYKDLYFSMVRASEKALRELEQQNFGNAQRILIAAQQEAEEAYLNHGSEKQQAEP